MQFGDARHVDTEDEIQSDFMADHASYLDIIGMADNVAHQVHLQLDQILDGVAQVQRVPFDFGFHPYGDLIRRISFRIDAGCRMHELRGDAAIWYLRPFGMDHAIKEVSVRVWLRTHVKAPVLESGVSEKCSRFTPSVSLRTI